MRTTGVLKESWRGLGRWLPPHRAASIAMRIRNAIPQRCASSLPPRLPSLTVRHSLQLHILWPREEPRNAPPRRHPVLEISFFTPGLSGRWHLSLLSIPAPLLCWCLNRNPSSDASAKGPIRNLAVGAGMRGNLEVESNTTGLQSTGPRGSDGPS